MTTTKKKRKPANKGRTMLDKDPSQRCAKFVAHREGFESHPYQDSGGVWTIGCGHTDGVGPRSKPITFAQAVELLQQDLLWASDAVNKYVKVPLNQAEHDMAVSLTENIGVGGLLESTFLAELNLGHRRKAADAMLLWVKDDDGDVLLGLQRRRAAERRVFLNGYHKVDA